MFLTIAIDGPTGAGKSTVARRVAAELGVLYLDTGAMYRALALKAQRGVIDVSDAERVEVMLAETRIDVRHVDGAQATYLDDEDVSLAIREHRVSQAASAISQLPCVRRALVAIQRGIAAGRDLVMDGRDIGTQVLPDASLKVFLTASPEARAKRRHDELIAKGQTVEYETVLSDLIARDERDTTREQSPLRVADDAMIVDSTAMDINEVVTAILTAARGLCGEAFE